MFWQRKNEKKTVAEKALGLPSQSGFDFPYTGADANDLDRVSEQGQRLVVVDVQVGGVGLRTRRNPDGKVVQQGTMPYLTDILDAMEKRGGVSATVAMRVRAALAEDKLDYMRVVTPISIKDGKSEVGNPTMQKFHI